MAMAVTQPEPQLLVVFHKPQHHLGYSASFSSYPWLYVYIVNCSILYATQCIVFLCPSNGRGTGSGMPLNWASPLSNRQWW